MKSLETELEHLQTEYKLVDRQRVKALQVNIVCTNTCHVHVHLLYLNFNVNDKVHMFVFL